MKFLGAPDNRDKAGLGGSDARQTGDQEAVCSIPAGSGNIVSGDHEIVPMINLFLHLIQEGQFSCQFLAIECV